MWQPSPVARPQRVTALNPSGAPARGVEAERAATRTWLHDRVLQLLEYAAAGGYADLPDVDELRRIVGLAADEVRRFVDGDAHPIAPHDLATALADAARDGRVMAGGLNTRVFVEPLDLVVPANVLEALAGAMREALVNVAKHARAPAP